MPVLALPRTRLTLGAPDVVREGLCMDCGLGFTDEQIAVITSALTAGVVGVVTLGLAYITKTIKSWLGK